MTDDQLQSLRLHERLLFERIRKMQSERAAVIKQLRRAIRGQKREPTQ